MNEKKYRERLQFQNQMISRQSKQIEEKNLEIEKLKQLLEKTQTTQKWIWGTHSRIEANERNHEPNRL